MHSYHSEKRPRKTACGVISGMVPIMMGLTPNSGWIEQSYWILEMIFSKRRKKFLIESMENLLFYDSSKFAKGVLQHKDIIKLL